MAAAGVTASHAADDDVAPLVDYYDGARAWDLGEEVLALGIWTTAARYGDNRATRELAELYEQGTDLPGDKGIAYFWFSVSARGGDESSKSDAARIAAELSPETIAELDRKVAEWQPEALPVDVASVQKSLAVEDAVASIDEGDETTLLAALDGGVSPDAAADGKPLVFLAVATKRVALVDALLLKGASVDVTLEHGVTPLHVAAVSGDIAIAKSLVSHGASAMIQDSNGALPSEIAARSGYAELALFLEEQFKAEATGFGQYLAERGYVDEPDQLFDPAARDRAIRMFQQSNALPVSGTIDGNTQGLAREAALRNKEVNFIYVIRYQTAKQFKVESASDRSASVISLRERAIEKCQNQGGSKCKFNFAPAGGCIAVAQPPFGEFRVSRLHTTAEAAENDAMARCTAEHSSGCTVWYSECAQES